MSGTGPALRNADVRGDHGPAEASGDQVPVLHAGAADDPRFPVRHPLHDQRVAGRRARELRYPPAYLDAGAVGSLELGRARGEVLREIAEQPDGAGRRFRVAVQADAQPMAGHHRHRRLVGGKDRLQAEAQRVAEERQVRVQVAARQADFGLCRAAASAFRRGVMGHVGNILLRSDHPPRAAYRRSPRNAATISSPVQSASRWR